MSRYILSIILSLILVTESVSAAVTYPSSTPGGETAGGTYNQYFTNMFTPICTGGQVISGFSSVGVPTCVTGGGTPTALGAGLAGTLNYLPKYTPDGTHLGNSQIFDNGTNVGIGTTTPSNDQSWGRLLDIHGGPHAKLLVTTDGGVKTGIFSHDGYNGKIGTESNNNLTLMAGYWNDVMTLTTGGNVGIGTTNPSHKMTVLGALIAGSNNGINGQNTSYFLGDNNNAAWRSFIIGDNNGQGWLDEHMFVFGEGNGFLVPTTDTSTSSMVLGYNNKTQVMYMNRHNISLGIGLNNSTANSVLVGVGDKNILVTNSSISTSTNSNVGIGTVTPTYKLDVAGDINFTGNLYKNGVLFSSSSQWTTSGNNIYNANTGNVGIGTTSPTSKLDVVGGKATLDKLSFRGQGGDSGQANDWYAIYQEAGPWSGTYPDLVIQNHTGIKYNAYMGYGGHQFFTGWNGSSITGLQMQITDHTYMAGNVTIGTDTPGAKLAVNSLGIIGGANQSAYDIGAGRIAAGQAIYSYGKICAGNSQGDCNGAGGFVADNAGNINTAGYIRTSNNIYTDQNYGNGLVGAYNSTRYQGVYAMGDAYKLATDGTTPGNLYGIAWTHENVGGQSISGLGHQALFMGNGVTQAAVGNGIWTRAGITALGDLRIGANASRLFMNDNDESTGGAKSIHANSNVIGFLNGGGSWLQYTNDAGQIWTPNYGWLHDKFLSKSSDTLSEVFNNGWYRSNGNAGWYSQTYGGGWWMTDSTWIRSYGGKYMYVDSVIQAGAYMNSPAYYYISDARLKKDLVKITSSLDKVTAMNGYYFKWKKDDKKDIGLIAQEVEKIFPDAVGEYTDPDSKKTYKNVEYGHLIAPVIEAIKELSVTVKAHTTEIDVLKSENELLKKRLDAIEARLSR